MKVENRLNGADVYTYQYTYPYNYTTSPFPEMILQNRLSSVIESITTYNNKEIDRKKIIILEIYQRQIILFCRRRFSHLPPG